MSRTRAAVPWLAGAALVTAGVLVAAVTPADEDVRDPFLIRGSVGDVVAARALTAEVQEASFADAVTSGDWTARGNWLVVTVSASAPLTEVDAGIGLATLVVDGLTFQASERSRDQITDADLRVGIDTVGMLAFELPGDIREGTGQLRLTPKLTTPQLDDVIAISVDLGQAPRASTIEIVPSAWAVTP